MKNIDSLKIASKLLKTQRESLKLSIREVSIELRLEEKIVRDIEDANFTSFKSYLFLKGYLLNYANLLGVHISLPGVENKTKNSNEDGDADKIVKAEKYKKKYLFMLFPVILLILVIYKVQSNDYSISKTNYTDDLKSIPGLPLKNTKESRQSVEKKLLNENGEINAKEDDSHNTVLSEVSDRIPLDVITKYLIDGQESVREDNDIPLKNKSVVKSSNTIIIGVDPEIEAVGKKLEIFYDGDSWTEIIDSYGNIVFFDLVKKGKTLEFNILAPFEILIGNATVVDIKYSNKSVSVGYVNPDNNVAKIKIKE